MDRIHTLVAGTTTPPALPRITTKSRTAAGRTPCAVPITGDASHDQNSATYALDRTLMRRYPRKSMLLPPLGTARNFRDIVAWVRRVHTAYTERVHQSAGPDAAPRTQTQDRLQHVRHHASLLERTLPTRHAALRQDQQITDRKGLAMEKQPKRMGGRHVQPGGKRVRRRIGSYHRVHLHRRSCTMGKRQHLVGTTRPPPPDTTHTGGPVEGRRPD